MSIHVVIKNYNVECHKIVEKCVHSPLVKDKIYKYIKNLSISKQ